MTGLNHLKRKSMIFTSALVLLALLSQPFLVFAENDALSDAPPPSPTDQPNPDTLLPLPTDTSESTTNPDNDPALDPPNEDPQNPIDPQQGEQSLQNEENSPMPFVDRETKKGINKPLSTDPSSGALNYSYELKLPPGRGEMTPDLALRYNSQSANVQTPFGSGWNVSIPSIERLNKEGSENLFTKEYFTSSLSGELVKSGTDTYIPKNEKGDFILYKFSNDTWTLTDKSGTRYTFGASAGSRQDDPTDPKKIFKWMLEEVRDANDNFILYKYYKNENEIYPEKIIYTAHSLGTGAFTINFLRENRQYTRFSYSTGFKSSFNQRINEIRIDMGVDWVRKYSLNYILADNNSGYLIESIVESGKDKNGTTISLPPVKFEYTKSIPKWTYDSSWSLPIPIINGGLFDHGFRFADINGDALQDIICFNGANNIHCSKNNVNIIALNTGNGWQQVSGKWAFPPKADNTSISEFFVDQSGSDTGLRTIDVNGDGLMDLVRGNGNFSKNPVYINNGSNWVYDANWSIPLPFINMSGLNDFGMRVADINGDGLVDILCHNGRTNGNCSKPNEEIFVHTGVGWKYASGTWHFPVKANNSKETETFVDSAGYDTGLRIMDVNGDGLADLVRADGGQSKPYVYLNNGHGWVYDANYSIPNNFINWQIPDTGTVNEDINGDGLVDMLCHNDKTNAGCGKGNPATLINIGIGFQNISNTWPPPDRVYNINPKAQSSAEAFVSNTSMDNGLRMLDINGDNLPDLVKGDGNYSRSVNGFIYLNNTKISSNLLNKIIYSSGGSSEISYKPSAQIRDQSGTMLNPKLYFVINTVQKITNKDGLGGSTSTEYIYENGYFYFKTPLDKKFAGFGKVSKINPNGTKEISYFSQGDSTDTSNGEYDDHISKAGQVYRQDLLDSSGSLVQQTTTKWEKSQNGTLDSYFVYPSQIIKRIFNGSNSFDIAESYSYDTTNGNLISKTEYGKVNVGGYQSFSDAGTDARTTEYTYATCSGCANLYLPKSTTMRDYGSNKVSETRLYYDGAPYGFADKGNITKEEKWISGNDYATTLKSYNFFGMPTSMIDPRGSTTNYTYDSHNLYPINIINALGQTITQSYDYNSGQVEKSIDVNGSISEVDYDGLGRPTAERTSSDSSRTSLITKATYLYNDSLSGTNVPYTQKNVFYSPTFSASNYTLTDGLGRKIRDVVQTGAIQFTATDTVYDSMGRVYQTSLPYYLSGSPTSYSGPTSNSSLITTSTYDALDRLTSMANTLGMLRGAHNLNTTTVIDQENHTKDFTFDAFGNMTSVSEHDGSSTYDTFYTYDTVGNLLSIKDALGNVRSFTYDALGNRLYASDLHAPLDSAYGVYRYSYDKNSNLVQKINPNGNTITYIYDALNRPTRESSNGATQISYSYDSCVNGIGKLCNASRTGSSLKSFMYTSRGLPMIENVTLGANIWATSHTYDFQGNILQTSYPDNSKVRFSRNHRALVSQIERQEPAGTWVNVINNVSYNELGQKTAVFYANGRTQTYSYNPSNQYRLSSIILDAPAGYIYPKMIDTSYTWSASGNLLSKTENANMANPTSFTYKYDDLSRLTSTTKTVNAPLTGYTESYSYNPIGNLTNKTGAGSYTYGGLASGDYTNPHAALSVGSNNYNYDKNGNLIQIGIAPNSTDLSYSYRNELVEYDRKFPTLINMKMWYDYNGDRVKTLDSSGASYTPNGLYEEKGSTKTKYIFLDKDLVATVEKNGTNPASISYAHLDHLGSTQMVTDGGGVQKLQEIEYLPFGEILSNTRAGTLDEVHKFTGHKFDNETGLNFMKARYQSGKEGRFYQQDAMFWTLPKEYLLDPQQQNSYAYARNNPIRYVDPDGNAIESAIVLAMAIYNKREFIYNKIKENSIKTWDPITNERIKTLDSRVQIPAANFINKTDKDLNIKLRIVESFRSIEEQDKLYYQSRTNPPTGPKVTNVKGGDSYHNFGLAFDVVRMENGKPNWNKPISRDIANIGIKEGFAWGGDWKQFKDYPHFQMSFGKTTKELRNALKIKKNN